MQMHIVHTPPAAGERSDVPLSPALRALVRDCLDDVDTLVEDYVAEVSTFAGYQGGRVPPEDLRETARFSFELLLRRVGGLPVPEQLERVSIELGRRRVHDGVPLEELLAAVRMDFVVLWNGLMARVPPADLAALISGAVRVWDAVELHTVHVHTGYLDEVAVLARARERERALLVGRLLSSDGTDPHLVAQVATALRVDAAAPLLVVVSLADSERALSEAAARSARGTAHVQHHNGRAVLLTDPGENGMPAWLHPVPCAVAPVAHGLARVPAAARAGAEIAALFQGDAGAVTLRQAWPRVAAGRLGEVAGMLDELVLGGLANAPETERPRLLETVTTYLHQGSVARTAQTLFCHRNTVLNRLSRFTGYRVRPDPAGRRGLGRRCARVRPRRVRATGGLRPRPGGAPLPPGGPTSPSRRQNRTFFRAHPLVRGPPAGACFSAARM